MRVAAILFGERLDSTLARARSASGDLLPKSRLAATVRVAAILLLVLATSMAGLEAGTAVLRQDPAPVLAPRGVQQLIDEGFGALEAGEVRIAQQPQRQSDAGRKKRWQNGTKSNRKTPTDSGSPTRTSERCQKATFHGRRDMCK